MNMRHNPTNIPPRQYFMTTERIGFSKWRADDLALATTLWGDPSVTRYISANGSFSDEMISRRLNTEIQNDTEHHVQYWPIFDLTTSDLIGCCGLRPYGDLQNAFEIGFHLRHAYWGKGFASEAAAAVVGYAFFSLGAQELRAGHHPRNNASKRLLEKLGFRYMKDEYYAPTGLRHPSYRLPNAGTRNET